MLFLTRIVGEKIIIGDDISFIITKVKWNNVTIGIEAPKDISIHRKEIYQVIQNSENKKWYICFY